MFASIWNAHLHTTKGSYKGSKNILFVKICFKSCTIKNRSQMFTSEKNTKQLTIRGGGGGVNPYGQPDRKISVFFDDFPYCSHKCEGKSWGGDTDACSLRFDWDWLRLDWSQIQKLSDIASLSFDLQVYEIDDDAWLPIKKIQLLKLSVRQFVKKTQHHLNVICVKVTD